MSVEDKFEKLKALSQIIPSTQKESEKIHDTIERVLHEHPELEQPFREYLKRGIRLDRNFEVIGEDGTIKFREKR